MLLASMGTPSKAEHIDKFSLVPYWWVQTTSDESIANMRMAVTKVDGDVAPVLQNTESVPCKTRLFIFKAKERRALTDVVAESASASPSSSKRAKKA